jgi:hypothetical protein
MRQVPIETTAYFGRQTRKQNLYRPRNSQATWLVLCTPPRLGVPTCEIGRRRRRASEATVSISTVAVVARLGRPPQVLLSEHGRQHLGCRPCEIRGQMGSMSDTAGRHDVTASLTPTN